MLHKIENELDIGGERKPKKYRSKLIMHTEGFWTRPYMKIPFIKKTTIVHFSQSIEISFSRK